MSRILGEIVMLPPGGRNDGVSTVQDRIIGGIKMCPR